jgi:rhodanese-related sulfurtransferase
MKFFRKVKPDQDGVVVLDVRSAPEWRDGHLEGAVLMDITSATFASKIRRLPKDAPIYVYCKSGNRARQACQLLRQAGYGVVINAGGLITAAGKLGRDVVY